jgi:hypothetical protein
LLSLVSNSFRARRFRSDSIAAIQVVDRNTINKSSGTWHACCESLLAIALGRDLVSNPSKELLMKANRNLRRNTVLALSGVAIVGVAAHAALAQTQPIGITQHDEVYSRMVAKLEFKFDDVDANRDGYIDRAEAASVPGLATVFDRADKNGDNKLDRVEFITALALMQARP